MRTVKIAAASVLMATALYGCSKGQEAPAQGAPPVTVAAPLSQQVVDWDEFTGRFEAPRSVDVRARVGGYIQSVHFKDGDFVRQGQLLFTLDPRPAQAALASARAQLAQGQAQLTLARTELTRAEGLLASQARAERENCGPTLDETVPAGIRALRLVFPPEAWGAAPDQPPPGRHKSTAKSGS